MWNHARCCVSARVDKSIRFNRHGIFRLKEVFVKWNVTGSLMDGLGRRFERERKREREKVQRRYLNSDTRV